MNEVFHRLASKVSEKAGHAASFVAACLLIIVWLVSGPIFGFSDTWQLVINTGTTIITFLMVFLIQNSQNRDSIATQLKLDELLQATKGASNLFVDLEEMTDDELQAMQDKFAKIHKRIEHQKAQRQGK